MKEFCLELASRQKGYNAKLNIMREYLQAYILRIMHDEGVFRTTAFLGGTALRFLFELPRFSEDLDFSLTGEKKLSFATLIKKLKEELILANYNISVTYNDTSAVNNAFVKFEGLMYEAGISSLKGQKFSIKIEMDANPPEGANLESQIVNKYFPISFLTYDLPSLFAGKLHAILNRKYTKGRDLYDLMWYLSKWKKLMPNFSLLENSLIQTAWKNEIPTETNWRGLIYKVVEASDWKKVKKDVENFLERPEDLKILTKENLLKALS